MRLILKRDAVATVLVGVSVALYLAFDAGRGLPMLDSARAVTAAVLLLGLAACVAGGGVRIPDHSPAGEALPKQTSGLAAIVIGMIGTLASVLAAVNLLIASTVVLDVLIRVIVGLWLIAVFRHAAAFARDTRPQHSISKW